MSAPKILFVDIETSPLVTYNWGLYDQNAGLNQIQRDWSILAFCAKWSGTKTLIYRDQSKAKDMFNDAALVSDLWNLLDECDIAVAHNGQAFDIKKINARFAIHGLKPPSPFKIVDTKLVAKRRFAFTSNKLEYLAETLNKKYKKQAHKEFPGFDLWKECLAGNPKAWKVMREYNQYDVLALEELWTKLAPWDSTTGLAVYYGPLRCNCGGKNLQRRGFSYTKVGKYQQYQCKDCGSWLRDSLNLVKGGIKRGC